MVESQLRQRGIRDERLLAAMSKVPRHEFVSQQNWNEAYADHPIPIAEKQTTSQPYMIAAMVQAAPARDTRLRCWPNWQAMSLPWSDTHH